jgi:hypothetical protein
MHDVTQARGILADIVDVTTTRIARLRTSLEEAHVEIDRLRQDSRDADAAATQAAFWRAEAIRMGADPEAYARWALIDGRA